MKIAQIASLWAPIPPPKYGGSELITSGLAKGLTQRGHKVTLFASGDSQTDAELVSVIDKALGPDVEQGKVGPDFVIKYEVLNNFVAFLRASEFDIIHCHSHYLGAAISQFVSTPCVHTLHSYPKAAELEIMKRAKTYYCSISDRFQEVAPDLSYFATVYNGIDISKLNYSESPKDNFVSIGRIYPKKGIAEAIQVALAAQCKLEIATPLPKGGDASWVVDQKYFEEGVKPHLNHPLIKHVGEIGQEEKSDFLSAKGLISPIKWEEPFGLVMVEAMACGTPVVAFRIGSVPEIVDDGVNGFIVEQNDFEGMVQAVKKLQNMPDEEYARMRLACRKKVEENFTVEKMLDRYEVVYKEVVNNHSR